MKKALLIVPLLLTACAVPNYAKPGITQAQATRDNNECQYEAQKSAAGLGTDDPIGGGLRVRDLAGQCLQLRGYTRIN